MASDELFREHQLSRAAFAGYVRVMSRLSEVLDRIDQSQQDLQVETRAQTATIIERIARFESGGEAGPAPT